MAVSTALGYAVSSYVLNGWPPDKPDNVTETEEEILLLEKVEIGERLVDAPGSNILLYGNEGEVVIVSLKDGAIKFVNCEPAESGRVFWEAVTKFHSQNLEWKE